MKGIATGPQYENQKSISQTKNKKGDNNEEKPTREGQKINAKKPRKKREIHTVRIMIRL